jgi:hypothetical protein
MVDEVLAEETIRRRGFFDPGFVRTLIHEHRSGAQDWSLQIWQLLTFELWLQTFIDGSGAHHTGTSGWHANGNGHCRSERREAGRETLVGTAGRRSDVPVD